MLAIIESAIVQGVEGHPVRVEVHEGRGLPAFNVVGLPDASCRESRDRVRAAIENSGWTWPNTKITVNLAPGTLPKHGASLDLPIALGVLVACTEFLTEAAIEGVGASGELGLDGSIRPVPGLISMAGAVNAKRFFAPEGNAAEAARVFGGDVFGAANLSGVVAHLMGRGQPLTPVTPAPITRDRTARSELADVRGQAMARYALEVAAAGGHHMLMIGSPGSGKTMLANRLVDLLPQLDDRTALEVTRVHSASGLTIPSSGMVTRPPLRAPHHHASAVAMIGGGSGWIKPGEISKAHGGVLFLDEMGEFPVSVLESLRQPLEEGLIRVSRSSGSAELPARFQLIGAMNPCPCGEGGAAGRCRCSDFARSRYLRRLSEPLLDRFDVRIEVQPPEPLLLLCPSDEATTAEVAERVRTVRERSVERGVPCNALIPGDRVDELCPLAPSGWARLEQCLVEGTLTGRGLRRVRLLARTIADLADLRGPLGSDSIDVALGLRTPLASTLDPEESGRRRSAHPGRTA